ncbi:probable protein ABIL1 [Dendrobium catenatum]|uniref:Uncharacterized protein n=1 Tax=Dendrobium catenatum TaxID=906689 RepID=A0A2I0VB92_9ASPA|nr:probable protein ABIL1 [Dendrobium catenatum]PKU60681.1 putative protein ABIL1 [Dendrobium catenatum]
MVLDDWKDHAVRALVNVVDHLGTVAHKLTDLYDQQTTYMSTVDLNISCLNQYMLTCQNYMEKEGIRQKQISGRAPRHHKHYILSSSRPQQRMSISTSPLPLYRSSSPIKPNQAPPCLQPPAKATLPALLSQQQN